MITLVGKFQYMIIVIVVGGKFQYIIKIRKKIKLFRNGVSSIESKVNNTIYAIINFKSSTKSGISGFRIPVNPVIQIILKYHHKQFQYHKMM